jgi:aromatic-L-amino-acid decarboxylase
VAARSKYMRLHPESKLEELVVLTTTQTHSLGKKAALVLGLKCRALPVTAEDRFGLRGETLRQVLEEDRLNGLKPFILSWWILFVCFLSLTIRSCYRWLNIFWSGRSSG